jgi:hypothetical protein
MSPRTRTVLISAIFALLAFVVGAAWQFTQARAARAQAEAAELQVVELQRQLDIFRVDGSLAAATIAAQLGGFERSRVFASEFFTALQAETDSLAPLNQPQIRAILGRRDSIITALSRAEPGIALELARTYVRFRGAVGGDPGIIELTPLPDSARR